MGEQDYAAEVSRRRNAMAATHAEGERAAAQDQPDLDEFAAFTRWLTPQAVSAGWEPVPLRVCTAIQAPTGFLGVRSRTQFEVSDHRDIRGLLVTEQLSVPVPRQGNTWLVTSEGEVYLYDADGWFEESLGPIAPRSGPEELPLKRRLRPLLVDTLVHHQAQRRD